MDGPYRTNNPILTFEDQLWANSLAALEISFVCPSFCALLVEFIPSSRCFPDCPVYFVKSHGIFMVIIQDQYYIRCPSWKFHNLIYIIAYFSLFNVPPSRQTLPRLGQGRGPCVNSRQIVQVHKTNLYCTRNPICNPCLPQKVTMVTLSGLPEAMQIWQRQTFKVDIF